MQQTAHYAYEAWLCCISVYPGLGYNEFVYDYRKSINIPDTTSMNSIPRSEQMF